jgi:hypothetical protein
MQAAVLLGTLLGCVTTPASSTGETRYIQIRDQMTPQDAIVQAGDEVRWQNLTERPVRVSLLEARGLDAVTCQKGFRRFGVMEDQATIAPRDFVCLCFGQAGVVRYNVWLDTDNLRATMTPTATIRVLAPTPARR